MSPTEHLRENCGRNNTTCSRVGHTPLSLTCMIDCHFQNRQGNEAFESLAAEWCFLEAKVLPWKRQSVPWPRRRCLKMPRGGHFSSVSFVSILGNRAAWKLQLDQGTRFPGMARGHIDMFCVLRDAEEVSSFIR